MEGVLQSACLLGLGKVGCSLFFLSTYPGLVSFCFSCLLMFTDLLVTGFLLVLCFADPSSWPLSPPPDGELIALRFLLFLGNTYAAALLLSSPLVLAETALRRYAGAMATAEEEEEENAGAEADAERDELRRLGHAGGYLGCLAAWVVSGLWAASVDQRPREQAAAACLLAGRPLVSCLPRILPAPPEPSCRALALLSLALALLLAWELAVWARSDKRRPPDDHDDDDDDDDDIVQDGGHGKSSSGWRQLAPPPWVHPEKASPSCVVTLVLPAPGGSSPPGQGTATDGGPGPGWGTLSGLGLALSTGLVWAISLCLLPPTLSVNVPLVQTLQAVVAMCADSGVTPPPRRRQTGASVLQSWRHYCGIE